MGSWSLSFSFKCAYSLFIFYYLFCCRRIVDGAKSEAKVNIIDVENEYLVISYDISLYTCNTKVVLF